MCGVAGSSWPDNNPPLPLTCAACLSVWAGQDADRARADVPAEGPHASSLRLLRGIGGVFRPYVLTALMGASGAGELS